MSTSPAFPCFHPTTETWDSYINCFNCFLDAAELTEISSHRKKAYFLSFCGAMVFDTATTLLAPQTVKSVSWDDLQEILSNHYVPKPSCIAKRHCLDEELRLREKQLAPTGLLFEQLSYTAVSEIILVIFCGVWDLRLLLAKTDLSLKMAVEEAQAAELSMLSAAEIQSSGCAPQHIHNQTEDCSTITRACHSADSLFTHSCQLCTNKIHVTVFLEGKACQLDVDTESFLSIVSWSTLKKLVPAITKK
ncbi:hypothetical protein E2320_009114 [Naja naja]|nr:hypothetical protein E2320_009114 [Naja naja]